MVRTSSIAMPSMVGLGFQPTGMKSEPHCAWHDDRGRPYHSRTSKTFLQKSLVFVFLSCHVFLLAEFVLTTLPLRRLNMETFLILLDKGRFVVVHPRSTVSLCR